MKFVSPKMEETLTMLKNAPNGVDILDLHINTLCALSTRALVKVIYPTGRVKISRVRLTPLGEAVAANIPNIEKAPRFRDAQRKLGDLKRSERYV